MRNAEPSMIAQSHSSIDKFHTCPRQFEATYVTGEVKFQETDATRLGNRVHSGIEYMIKNPVDPAISKELRAELDAYPLINKTLDKITGVLSTEVKLAVDESFNYAAYQDKSRTAFRAIVDLIAHDKESKTLTLVDWKTGKLPWGESSQLAMSAAICAGQPEYAEVETINTEYVYLRMNTVVAATYKRSDIPVLRKQLVRRVIPIVSAYESGVFVPTPNGLCRNYCPVTRCEFHGRGRR